MNQYVIILAALGSALTANAQNPFPLFEAEVGWWDDHYTIEKNLRRLLPIYDQGQPIRELF